MANLTNMRKHREVYYAHPNIVAACMNWRVSEFFRNWIDRHMQTVLEERERETLMRGVNLLTYLV